jgi:hypothetical protein
MDGYQETVDRMFSTLKEKHRGAVGIATTYEWEW